MQRKTTQTKQTKKTQDARREKFWISFDVVWEYLTTVGDGKEDCEYNLYT